MAFMFNVLLLPLVVTFLTFIPTVEAKKRVITHKVYFDINHGEDHIGRIEFGLFGVVVPKTVENFYELTISEDPKMGYVDSIFHRVIPDLMIQGGDFTNRDGTGGESIFGSTFEDENFEITHDEAGLLSMANRGEDTNGSQFFITLSPTPWLNNKHVVFGKVINGMEVVEYIARVDRDMKTNKPLKDVTIVECGELETVPLKQDDAKELHSVLEEEAAKEQQRQKHDEL
ncbi:peptidylprolyl isomerase family protein CPR5 NDAI_0C04180 [Naumovozyma dairenensis CBS 421]|uniref:Peptidyl-prolyl cis-trans isomerase n=1 Tax=Naumovozyma dairenensis (strain ATCC 10597 / BCRC 20456 / CBS 421 / NBRC 0211 / NRRL Y-12639) TaxID=1071378 RepID=G0W8G7_NAUDC|nr:hypothetical protein NDAI_0C04180 [Naumovozyma dairenensis CBS 421]CCD24078.1 hypothetical protein NDAI_0C04180 [Naumovozyma dairenensis CBS 421]